MSLRMDAYSYTVIGVFLHFLNVMSQQSLFIRAGLMKYSSASRQVMNDFALLQPGQISTSYFAVASLSSDLQQLAG